MGEAALRGNYMERVAQAKKKERRRTMLAWGLGIFNVVIYTYIMLVVFI